MINHAGQAIVLANLLLFAAGCGANQSTPPSPTATPTVAATMPETAPPSPTEQPIEQTASQASPSTAQTAEQADAISSYRLHIVTQSESPRGADKVEVDGAFVKEPPAQELTIRFQEGEQVMAMTVVDGVRYMQMGDQWFETPEATINLSDLTLITPDDVTGLLARMTQVGVEEVNGVQAMHYRGGQEMIPVVGSPGDTLDVSQLAFAQVDLWIDQATNVVTRLQLQANDDQNDASTLEVVFDYYDFNTPITIEKPAVTVDASSLGESSAASNDIPPGDTLSQLLGFRFMLPTGSTVEAAVGATLVTALTPYTVAEAQRLIEQILPANGYTLVTKAETTPGQTTYLFQQGEKVVNVTISDGGGDAARLHFVAAP
jgi:hypothetical protein